MSSIPIIQIHFCLVPVRALIDHGLQAELQALSPRLSGKDEQVERLLTIQYVSDEGLAARAALVRICNKVEGSLIASISHSRGFGLAAVAPAMSCVGLGVDLERFDRTISISLANRIGSDAPPGLEPIEIWVEREALYKSDPDPGARGIMAYRAEATGLKDGCISWSRDGSSLRFVSLTARIDAFQIGLALSLTADATDPLILFQQHEDL